MKSEDLINSNELENPEITEEQTDSVVESEIEEVSETKKPVKEKVKKPSAKPKKTKAVDLTPEIEADTNENPVVENTVTETISETEQPLIELVEEKIGRLV